jgi:hypothetical protein
MTSNDTLSPERIKEYMDKNDLVLVMMNYKDGTTHHTKKSMEMVDAIEEVAFNRYVDKHDTAGNDKDKISDLVTQVIKAHVDENHDPEMGRYIVPYHYSLGVQDGVKAALSTRTVQTPTPDDLLLGYEIMGDTLFFGVLRSDGVKLNDIWYMVDMNGITEEAKTRRIQQAEYLCAKNINVRDKLSAAIEPKENI